jgi:hypothetical protein
VFVTQSAAKTKENLRGVTWPKIPDGFKVSVGVAGRNLRRCGRLRIEKEFFTMGEWPVGRRFFQVCE